jgi:predicted DNA-binding protein (MmcQ/YjbR family)
MNKKYWLTILLNGQVSLAKVKKLVSESYATVTGKKKATKQ